ncbi:hypothetical protein C7B77_25230 [Chamaesiphon polymorphus CCALA 037]|uniref:Uncharacterized protein n=1 Tax=Chamaesiphon polymorphus CCALA 037 TaxID=2107692 RepID=A0A2T1FKC6_9CYAN|nr:hypothetical protein C7B77_25230 [Chamaesiphon polymorphus CCALA 037]
MLLAPNSFEGGVETKLRIIQWKALFQNQVKLVMLIRSIPIVNYQLNYTCWYLDRSTILAVDR